MWLYVSCHEDGGVTAFQSNDEQGYLKLDQVAQRPVQPDLVCFQGGASNTSLGNLFQFQHPHNKRFLP